MPEIFPSWNSPNLRAMIHPKIDAANDGRSQLCNLLTRRRQSLLALNAFTLWVLALAVFLFALGFHYYGWGKHSSVGLSRFEVRVTVPPAPDSLDRLDTEMMHAAMDLGGVAG